MHPIPELKIAFCSDHAGYELKNQVIDYLKSLGLTDYKDFGAYSSASSDYPDFAHAMAAAIESGEYRFGISCCGSGNGINITANRHAGVRSAICWLPEIARLARAHNNANVLALPARFIAPDEARAIVDAFFTTNFEGGRHQRRIEKIEITC
ncbi:MAG: ribose 5-phosphate isomerase B [Paludibacter sp.]|jgi:ribose 5-phosphate isomerase B|nr:ribose 5-phosphate isomerase B [Paludibacter sp.]